MTKEKTKQLLQSAVLHATPQWDDALLQDLPQQEPAVVVQMPSRRRAHPMLAVAAALLLLVGGVMGYRQYQTFYALDAIVGFDVNPSIELRLSRAEKVLEARALNQDAAIILEGMDLKGSSLNVAVNALLGSMLQNGYLGELSNSILISVENDDVQRAQELQDRLTQEVNRLLTARDVEPAIVSQTIPMQSETTSATQPQGVSPGKAELVRQLAGQNSKYREEELMQLSINELLLLVESGKNTLSGITSTGEASDRAYLGNERALQCALDWMGVAAADLRWKEIELDYDDGRMVYEVEFVAGNMEYECDVDARTGDVLSSSKERLDDWDDFDDDDRDDFDDFDDFDDRDDDRHDWEDRPKDDVTVPVDGQEADAPVNLPQHQGSVIGNGQGEETISKQDATQIALEDAGLTKSDTRKLKCELDYDDGRLRYEVEFKSGRMEYEYEIDAQTGAILSRDIDEDD